MNGQAAVVWDATNGAGKIVPNGFYHLVLTQVFTDGTSARREKDIYIGPEGQTTSVQLRAQPNLARPGDTILFSAWLGSSPVDERSFVRVYSIGGEKVRSLRTSRGQASWDLTNGQGQAVASGIYLILLDGVDPATGAPARKTIKVIVLR